jgi:hypothetical protein
MVHGAMQSGNKPTYRLKNMLQRLLPRRITVVEQKLFREIDTRHLRSDCIMGNS